MFRLDCNISRGKYLPPSTLLEVTWLDNINNTIISNSNISISGNLSSTATFLYSNLMFTRIKTSQGGRYSCAVNMSIFGVVNNHRVTKSRTVIVMSKCAVYTKSRFAQFCDTSSTCVHAVAPATSVTLSSNRGAPHYWGTTLTLTCTVEYDSEVVDTAVAFNISITTNTSSMRVSTNVQTNVGTALFSPLLPRDDGNVYFCLSSILPESNTQFVNYVSNSLSDPVTINLTGI